MLHARAVPAAAADHAGSNDKIAFPAGARTAKLARGRSKSHLEVMGGLYHGPTAGQTGVFRTMIDWLDGHLK
jgi:hypothetical protein